MTLALERAPPRTEHLSHLHSTRQSLPSTERSADTLSGFRKHPPDSTSILDLKESALWLAGERVAAENEDFTARP